MRSGIYSITCVPTGQKYIGTAIDWEKRITQHINKLKRNKHKNTRLQIAWNERGPNQFEFKLIEECEIAVLLERERFWIVQTRSDIDGFNFIGWLGSNGFLKHGLSQSRAFKSWDSMIQRCTNPNNKDFSKYGAIGVKICERWLESFENFYADMGDRPEGTSLDRYPSNEGNYEPGNCRWATPKQQQRNLTSNQYITLQGVSKLTIEWAEELGIPKDVLRRRALRGLQGEALLAPTYKSFKGIRNADGILPKRQRKETARTVTAFGKTQTVAAWASELNISKGTLEQRLFRYKMPPEKALVGNELKKGKTGPRKGHRMITAFGKTQSLTAWSREYDISIPTLKNRLGRAKMKPEDALLAPLYTQQRGKT